MSWMNDIISWLKSIEEDLYDAYLVVWGWYYPFWLLGYPLLYVSRGFGWLAYYFGKFNNWLVWANNELGKILSWSTIRSYIRSWLPSLEDAIDWFIARFKWFTTEVTNWWQGTTTTVKGWIATATQGLDTLKVAWDSFWRVTFPQWTSKLDSLGAAWDNFWTVTFPNLVSFQWLTSWWNGRLKEVDGLIDSKIKELNPLFAGWQEIAAGVVEFFADPLDWIKLHVIEPLVDDFNRGFSRGISGEEK